MSFPSSAIIISFGNWTCLDTASRTTLSASEELYVEINTLNKCGISKLGKISKILLLSESNR